MKLKALGHRVLCVADKIENKTKSGLYMPDQTVDMERAGANRGTVVDIGPTAWKTEQLGGTPWCKVGDRIMWPRYAGAIVKHDGEDYHLINDEDVVALEVSDE